MSTLLTPAEQQRFAEWCELQALTARGIIEQMEKLGPAFAVAIQRERIEKQAFEVIARKLRATESYSIGGGNEAPPR